MDFARWFYWAHKSDEKTGVSLYDTMKQVEKSTGKTPVGLLNAPKIPKDTRHLWQLFNQLDIITYTELDAYQRQTGDDLAPWELDVIMGLNLISKSEPKCPQNAQT